MEPNKVSADKILSTEDSKNSSCHIKHKLEDQADSSLKLFTFMNCFDEKPNMKKHLKNKVKPKVKGSCLKELIDESRKKRESFLNNITETETKLGRKCKTPRNTHDLIKV